MIIMNLYYSDVLSRLYNHNTLNTQMCAFYTIPWIGCTEGVTLANVIKTKIKFIMYIINK